MSRHSAPMNLTVPKGCAETLSLSQQALEASLLEDKLRDEAAYLECLEQQELEQAVDAYYAQQQQQQQHQAQAGSESSSESWWECMAVRNACVLNGWSASHGGACIDPLKMRELGC